MLVLTSPRMRGAAITAAQHLLSHNRFQNFHPGPIDGVYGEQTAQATRDAKYWLGYRKGVINGRFGPELHDYLKPLDKDGKRLSLAMAIRRRHRLAKLKRNQKPIGAKALALAITQLGIKEYPYGSNRCKFTAWYGDTGPWCAMFASWCYAMVGSKHFAHGVHYSYCPYILADARAGRNGLSVTHSPQAGDLVLYCWDGTHVPEHVGLFSHALNSNEFYAIEGNTAIGNDSNGGEVMKRLRYRSQVVAFVRIAA